MRIQHNIMAMNAYRNYTNNVSAMKSNLEKLSSGYKINRAGDDAAGLAISEKMRAQITGLQTAQKNAKDGISLVQTAEGALTEVHDMLNRMVTLATQSANGTYDDGVDRAQMEKELDQLKSEIDRIADSANFNGIKLLDGSMDGAVADKVIANTVYGEELSSGKIQQMMLPKSTDNDPTDAADGVGKKTILETESGNASYEFSVRFDGISHVMEDTTDAASGISLKIGGTTIATISEKDLADYDASLKAGSKVDSKTLARVMANKIQDAYSNAPAEGTSITLNGGTAHKFTVKADGDKLVFTMTDDPTAVENMHDSVTIDTTYVSTKVAAVANAQVFGFAQGQGTAASAVDTSIALKATIDGEEVTFKVTDNITDNTEAADVVKWLKNATGKTEDGKDIVLRDFFNLSVSGTDIKFEDVVPGKEGSGNSINEITMSGSDKASTFTEADGQKVEGKDGYTTGTTGYANAASEINIITSLAKPDTLASTTLDMEGKYVDGAKLRLGDQEYIFAVGEDSKYVGGENVIDLTGYDKDVHGATIEEYAGTKLTEYFKEHENEIFSVGHSADPDEKGHITLKQKAAVKDTTDMTTMKSFASYIGYSKVDEEATRKAQADAEAANAEAAAKAGKALTLQIGDTADKFNQLEVNIKDCHVAALGLKDMSIADQDSAAKAVDIIKSAINYVSDVRGTLGATQNRLDHTMNNLSVMTENIQDAESTIRDVDVAEEMMAYTKNNILIQSAQAMLAQANQVPQGVLQLLG